MPLIPARSLLKHDTAVMTQSGFYVPSYQEPPTMNPTVSINLTDAQVSKVLVERERFRQAPSDVTTEVWAKTDALYNRVNHFDTPAPTVPEGHVSISKADLTLLLDTVYSRGELYSVRYALAPYAAAREACVSLGHTSVERFKTRPGSRVIS